MKKRLCALLLLFAITFTAMLSLSSCGEKYEPVESTAEEKRTVMKISYGGEKYEVPFELYRAFFLQLKSSVDGGNNNVWSGSDKEIYIKAVDELIYRRIAEIYAVFHLCKKADIDVYSKDFNKQIQNHIEIAVEGGTFNGTTYVGFGGDYDKYLASLKKMNLNYSAQVLLLRYQLAYETLADYYIGNFNGENPDENAEIGTIKYTKEDVKDFYLDQDESRRVIVTQLPETYFTKERATEIRNKIASKKTAAEVANYVAGFTLSDPTSEVIGKYTYDTFYYSELTDTAFSLDVGATSDIITLKTDVFDGYIILYRLDATDEFFNSDYEKIAESYLYSKFGETVSNAREAIYSKIAQTDTLKNLDRSQVTMG